MNNLVRLENTQQVTIWDDQSQLNSIKEIYGKGLNHGEFKTFVEIGRATGLNPFLREIWAVKYGQNAASIFIGRDGYRRSAQTSRDYDYHTVDAIYSNDTFEMSNGEVTHKYSFKDRGELIGAYCQVKRKSASRPIFVFVDLKEYSTGKSLWQSKPATMIKKVAEAQGLRMAFQELFGGTYDESENWRDERTHIKTQEKGINGLKAKLGIQQVTQEEPINEIINNETGEVVEADYIQHESLSDIDSVETIKFKIESATTIKDLIESIDLVNALPNSQLEDKKVLMKLYREKKIEIESQ